MKKKFNNRHEFNEWVNRHILDEPVIPKFNETPNPNQYPCIMTYEFIENTGGMTEDEYEKYEELKEQGYEDDVIEKLIYDFVYQNDF